MKFLALAVFLALAESPTEIVLQSGHGANISALAFSPDGHFLVSASEDSTLKLWDPETGAEIRTLRGHANIVTSLALSDDGTRMASASLDHTLRVWNAATEENLRNCHVLIAVITEGSDVSEMCRSEQISAIEGAKLVPDDNL